MLTMNITAVCRARGILYPHAFLMKQGISRNVASRITSGKAESIKVDHLEKICRALNCEPSDLFRFQSKPNESLPKNHSLLKLQTDTEISELGNIPYQQLLEITKNLENS